MAVNGRPRGSSFGVLLAISSLLACGSSPSIPSLDLAVFEHDTDAVAEEETCDLWTSYQIAIESIDGVATDYAPSGRGIYYRVSLSPGDHVLELRLDYRSATHLVRSEDSIKKTVTLNPGQSYTLFDLTAGADGERVFTPWVESGAPEDEEIELVRPKSAGFDSSR